MADTFNTSTGYENVRASNKTPEELAEEERKRTIDNDQRSAISVGTQNAPYQIRRSNEQRDVPVAPVQDKRQAAVDSWAAPIHALQAELDQYQQRTRGAGDHALQAAFAPRNPNLMTPEQVAAEGDRRTTIPQGELDPYRADRQGALNDMRGLLDRIYSAPSVQALTTEERRALEAEHYDKALQQQLSVGRSAPGGLAGVQQGVESGMNQSGQLATAAAGAARDDASAQLADRMSVFRGELDRFGQAANVTQQVGQTATTAFGQEADVRVQQAQLGLGVTQELGRLTGLELQLDQSQRESVGRMATDIMSLDLQSMQLSQQAQQQFFDAIVRMYGIDQATYAAIRQAAISKQVGPLDVLQMVGGIVGGVAGIGAAAVGGK